MLVKNLNSTNQEYVKIIHNLLNSNLKNNSGAINAPFGNVTKIFENLGNATPIYLIVIVAMAMVIPLVIDMFMAYRRNSKIKSNDMDQQPPIGMQGLYRTLMTFGVVILVGIVLMYLLLLITIYNNTALIETLRNLSTILGTGLATIIAFYFGMRGTDSAIEKTARRLAPAGTIGDLSTPSVIKPKPDDNAENVPINTDIYAKFSEQMDTTTINKGTFNIVDSKNNVIDGNIIFVENNTKALFKPAKLEPSTKYTATIESEVTDVAGNPMYEDFSWSFTTKDATSTHDTKLAIDEQSTDPKANTEVDPTNIKQISFKFNNEIDEKTITTVTVKLLEGGKAIDSPYSVEVDKNDKKRIIITLNKTLKPKTTYTIEVGAGVQGIKGNKLEKDKESWSFTTK